MTLMGTFFHLLIKSTRIISPFCMYAIGQLGKDFTQALYYNSCWLWHFHINMQTKEELLLYNWPNFPFPGTFHKTPTMKCSEKRNHFCLCKNRSELHEAKKEISKRFKDHKEKL